MNLSKPTIKVVRIEDPESGDGFWFSEENFMHRYFKMDYGIFESIKRRHDSDDYPTYQEDQELNSQISWEDVQYYRFAFNSMDQFKVAFTSEEIKEAIRVGFKVYLLSVDDYYSSKYQTVFRNPESKEDITELFV